MSQNGNAVTVPLGFFVVTDFEIPYARLDKDQLKAIDSLTPKVTMEYSMQLSDPVKGTVWTHDTTLTMKLPRFTHEKDSYNHADALYLF